MMDVVNARGQNGTREGGRSLPLVEANRRAYSGTYSGIAPLKTWSTPSSDSKFMVFSILVSTAPS